MDIHQEEVALIAERVREFSDHQTPFYIYHGSTNSTRQSQFQRDAIVDTSHLVRILKVDTDSKTVLVEPNVPMDSLVEATLQYGLIPPVVMEFPGITVGGGFAGTAAESSSFRHGFFEQTVNWIEIILPSGEVVTSSGTHKSDLHIPRRRVILWNVGSSDAPGSTFDRSESLRRGRLSSCTRRGGGDPGDRRSNRRHLR
jgi:Delta24-sterol reductase